MFLIDVPVHLIDFCWFQLVLCAWVAVAPVAPAHGDVYAGLSLADVERAPWLQDVCDLF